MDLCHLENSELEPQYQKYKGRVVLRGDIVKNDSGCYTVFTKQGLSASQMTAARVMDVIARLPTRMRRTSSGRNICLYLGQNGRCTDVIGNSKVRMPMEDPVVHLERNLYGKGNLRKFSWNTVGKKF